MICNCQDWKDNINLINAGFCFIHARNPHQESGYTGKKFQFCPFCAGELEVKNQPATYAAIELDNAFPKGTFIKFTPEIIDFKPTIMCDHLCSGNACCPCGYYKNPYVKSVCTMINGQQTWNNPYGETGISYEEARKILLGEDNNLSELSLINSAWNKQMINGEEYFNKLSPLDGGKRYIESEKLK